LSTDEVVRRATRIVVSRLAVVGGVVAAPTVATVVAFVSGQDAGEGGAQAAAPSELLLAAVCAALSTAALSLGALHRTPPGSADAPSRAFRFAMVAGVLNAPAWLMTMLVASLVSGACDPANRVPDASTVVLVVLAASVGTAFFTVIALVVTLPLGAAYGVVHACALHALHAEIATPSWRALGRARAIALVTETIGLGVLGVIAAAYAGATDLAWIPMALVLGLFVVDAALLVRERWRIRSWVAFVRRAPGLALVPLAESSVPAQLAPVEPIDWRTVAVVRTKEGAPYRAAPTALALVPRA
jgi:hypothetical protein